MGPRADRAQGAARDGRRPSRPGSRGCLRRPSWPRERAGVKCPERPRSCQRSRRPGLLPCPGLLPPAPGLLCPRFLAKRRLSGRGLYDAPPRRCRPIRHPGPRPSPRRPPPGPPPRRPPRRARPIPTWSEAPPRNPAPYESATCPLQRRRPPRCPRPPTRPPARETFPPTHRHTPRLNAVPVRSVRRGRHEHSIRRGRASGPGARSNAAAPRPRHAGSRANVDWTPVEPPVWTPGKSTLPGPAPAGVGGL